MENTTSSNDSECTQDQPDGENTTTAGAGNRPNPLRDATERNNRQPVEKPASDTDK